MIFLRAPIERSGLDSFGPKTAETLRRHGVACSYRTLWPKSVYSFFCSGRLPFGRTIFRRFLSGPLATWGLRSAQKGHIAWILSFCSPFRTEPIAEKGLKARGLHYIFHVMDDWFDIPNLKQGTILRCQIADLVGVPTKNLKERVLEFIPNASVEVFEEPTDLCRLQNPMGNTLAESPVVLWCGNPYNLDHARMLLGVLRKVHRQKPFQFRVICGQSPPREFAMNLDLRWCPFDHENEGSLIAGSWVGLAPMPDTGHNRCKGAYKVKTYLAAGLPVVASPVGFQKDLIQEGPNIGFLPKTSEEWASAILSLIQDRKYAQEMGQRARAYAETRFSYDAIGFHWASLLQKNFGAVLKHGSET
jgi:glycosyltransferase involved in cell wall biosynthesis